ncbi:MucR family transcriptional regulator [Bombella intestini]|uniref:MucR family transcriptional regulator n=1 Tax=Bombella intestini TaxID=1539051 RepID=A0A1S8GNQ9_9PROT|nr:MucR family transcriptional regulator [Bombella intestini]OOL17699.1 MucR family transcriptional regulator [Bombella intestini]
MSSETETQALRQLTAQIVTAYVSSHDVAAEALPDLVRSVHGALADAGVAAEAEPEKPVPAVPPRKSVFPDYIICLEDGKKLKLLRRHLKTAYNMTPQEYRERWGLPPEYPMVAPNYANHRSSLARRIGLGRRRETSEPS